MEDLSVEKLMEAIQGMKGLSDEDREEIMNSLSQQNKPGVPAPLPEPPFTHQAMVLAVMLTLVGIIFERVKMSEADVLKDMLRGLGGLGKEVGMNEEDSEKAGSILQQLISGYKDLDDEEKKDFIENVQQRFQGKVQEAFTSHITKSYYMKGGLLLFCVIFIVSVFVFFGYKLIKSIKEKEKKKEEKKKQKQSKKRK